MNDAVLLTGQDESLPVFFHQKMDTLIRLFVIDRLLYAPDIESGCAQAEQEFLEKLAEQEAESPREAVQSLMLNHFGDDSGFENVTGLEAYQNLEFIFDCLFKAMSVEEKLNWERRVQVPQIADVESRHKAIQEINSCITTINEIKRSILLTVPVGAWLREAKKAEQELTPRQIRNLELMTLDYQFRTRVNPEVDASLTAAINACYEDYLSALNANDGAGDFSLVAGSLQTLIDLQRQASAERAGIDPAAIDTADPVLRAELEDRLFEQRLQLFERDGLSAATINHFFADLAELFDIRKTMIEFQDMEVSPLPLPILPRAIVEKICYRVASEIVGFDFSRGRMDHSSAPYTATLPGDTRFTASFDDPNNFLPALMSTLHEAGHGTFEQNMRGDVIYQPVSEMPSVMVHETQAFIWQRYAAGSVHFASALARIIHEETGEWHPALSADNLYRYLNRISNSLNRKESDSLGFIMHIDIRYRISRDLYSGKLKARDLPQRWDDEMEAAFGRRPAALKEGCLQDIHFYRGLGDYFCLYALGLGGAAQMYRKFIDTLPRSITTPEYFRQLRDWLKENVQRHGAMYTPEALMVLATDKPLAAQGFLTTYAPYADVVYAEKQRTAAQKAKGVPCTPA